MTDTPIPVPVPHAIEPIPVTAMPLPYPAVGQADSGGLDITSVVIITVLTVLALKTIGAAWDRIEDLLASRR